MRQHKIRQPEIITASSGRWAVCSLKCNTPLKQNGYRTLANFNVCWISFPCLFFLFCNSYKKVAMELEPQFIPAPTVKFQFSTSFYVAWCVSGLVFVVRMEGHILFLNQCSISVSFRYSYQSLVAKKNKQTCWHWHFSIKQWRWYIFSFLLPLSPSFQVCKRQFLNKQREAWHFSSSTLSQPPVDRCHTL